MIISVDLTGKVVQNLISNLAFGAMFANDIVFVDPETMPEIEESPYQVIVPRMTSRQYPQEFEIDNETLVAIGN